MAETRYEKFHDSKGLAEVCQALRLKERGLRHNEVPSSPCAESRDLKRKAVDTASSPLREAKNPRREPHEPSNAHPFEAPSDADPNVPIAATFSQALHNRSAYRTNQ